MIKQTVLIIIAAMIALAAGIMARNGGPLLETVKQPLPAFSFPDLNGKMRAVSEWQGKVLIINFWATWCPPCKKEIPEFVALQKHYADRLQFIGIAIDDKEQVADYLSAVAINYPMLIAADQGVALAHQMGNLFDTVPFTVVVDAEGRIVHRQAGEFSRQKIVDIVGPLLRPSG